MEQNMPIISKKVWNIMRIALVMLRKGVIPKKKLLLDLNMLMKKGKLLRKLALGNLMLHLHNHHHAATTTTTSQGGAATHLHHYTPGEYEFSCSSTPLYRHYFNKKKSHNKNNKNAKDNNFILGYEESDSFNLEAVNKVLEMMLTGKNDVRQSPVIRQLRIMDSPFRAHENVEEDIHVDKTADEFIKRFYSELNQQD